MIPYSLLHRNLSDPAFIGEAAFYAAILSAASITSAADIKAAEHPGLQKAREFLKPKAATGFLLPKI